MMTERTARRDDALSRSRILEAATEILDTEGEGRLTFRALASRLSTGAGAIYHHVSNKDELLAEAADAVIAPALARAVAGAETAQSIKTMALAIFESIDAHPWVGAQLAREPRQPAVQRMWKALGLQLRDLGVTGTALADAGSALVSFILGSAAQHAAGARQALAGEDRAAYLEQLAEAWTADDTDPLVREVASTLREHNDRKQFLAGVDIFLAGIRAGVLD